MSLQISVQGADSLARRLALFRAGAVLTETADVVKPTLITALRLAAPRDTGNLSRHIWVIRRTSLVGSARVDLLGVTDVDYAEFVLRGTRPHDISAPGQGPGSKNAKALHWYDQMGDDVFAKTVHHPGTKPNPFPRRVWIGLREAVMMEMVFQVRRKLGW
jgi:hypothetical protein